MPEFREWHEALAQRTPPGELPAVQAYVRDLTSGAGTYSWTKRAEGWRSSEQRGRTHQRLERATKARVTRAHVAETPTNAVK